MPAYWMPRSQSARRVARSAALIAGLLLTGSLTRSPGSRAPCRISAANGRGFPRMSNKMIIWSNDEATRTAQATALRLTLADLILLVPVALLLAIEVLGR